MRWTLLRSCIFTAAVLVLPGCLLINAALTGLGFIGTGGLEYAGTVYSIAEYSYEYAANDKTPDEVIEDKLAWLVGEDEETTMLAETARPTPTPSMANNRPNLHLLAQKRATPTMRSLVEPDPAMIAALEDAAMNFETAAGPIPVSPLRITKKGAAPVKPVARMKRIDPQHQYIARDTDPLLTRLDRLELAFRQAEAVVAGATDQGVKLSIQPNDGAPEEQGISGSWSIRHTIMQRLPATSASILQPAGIS